MKKKYFLALINLVYSIDSQAQWTNVSFNKLGEVANYYTLSFVDKNVGVVSQSSTNVLDNPKYSYTTFNKGKTWVRTPMSTDGNPLQSPLPLTAGIWIKAMGELSISKDSLKTFKTMPAKGIEIGGLSKLCKTTKNLYVFSVLTNNILKSENMGESWSECFNSRNVIIGGEYQLYHDMSFPTAEVGYLVGKNSAITKTINGGSSWFNLTLPFGS